MKFLDPADGKEHIVEALDKLNGEIERKFRQLQE